MGEETRIKLKGAVKIAGEKLRESTVSFGQATQFLQIDMTEIEALKKLYKDQGKKLSTTAIYTKAVAEAMREHPQMNARLEGDTVIRYEDVNPGIAVDTPKGLLVVVLPRVQGKSLDQINEELADLIDRTKNNRITMDDFRSGTVTISNMAMMNADFFTSIVNNFEAVIMGFARTRKCAVVDDDDNIVIRPMSYVMVNINHTITSGVPANLFLNTVARNLEHPKEYLL